MSAFIACVPLIGFFASRKERRLGTGTARRLSGLVHGHGHCLTSETAGVVAGALGGSLRGPSHVVSAGSIQALMRIHSDVAEAALW